MATLTAEQSAQIIVGLEHMRNVTYMHVASLVILVLDTLFTLDIEVAVVWNAKWNFMKVLYLVTRYLPFFDTPLSIALHLLIPGASAETCSVLYEAGTWLILAGICLSEIILTLRTWAVLGNRKVHGIILSVFFALTWISGLVVVGVSIYGSHPYTFLLQDILKPILKGCYITGGGVKALTITWALLIVYSGVLLIFMSIPAYKVFRGSGQSKLVRVVFRDGIIYYIYLFVMTLGNILVVTKLDNDYFTILLIFERVMYSLLACRVILHTRELAWRDRNYDAHRGVNTVASM